MNTTLKQQIEAINRARKNWKANPKTRKTDTDNFLSRLNDASSTISAINLIGTKTVIIAPELVQACRELVMSWNNGTMITEHITAIQKILNRLSK